ncbi:MAG: HAD-IIIA family hydrolase [Kiritimatiellaceae bacterium]|nr:HAD-IIIA family hydrolase [Kiritimatiellaceae bacterium]
MQKQLLIFDLDGTLADTRADLATGINLMRAHYGLSPLSMKKIETYVGDGIRVLVERSLEGAAVDVDEALALDKKFYAEHMLDETVLYPGVADGLKKLAADGHLLAVLSNKPGDPSRTILNHLGVGHLFSWIIGGGDLPNLKPSPDGILALIGATGIAPENVWMLGDHHTDLEVAHNAGVKSGFVTYGIGHTGQFTPDQVWNRFGELVDFFIGSGS